MEYNISISDPNAAKNIAGDLNDYATKISKANEALKIIVDKLGNYWSSSSTDQQNLVKNLKNGIDKIDTISECNKELSEALTEYVTDIEKTSANKI